MGGANGLKRTTGVALGDFWGNILRIFSKTNFKMFLKGESMVFYTKNFDEKTSSLERNIF